MHMDRTERHLDERKNQKQNGPAEEPSSVALYRLLDKALQQSSLPETKDAMKAKLSIFVKPI